MCGIFASFIDLSHNIVQQCVEPLKARGPDETVINHFPEQKMWLGFTRLAINGIQNGSQPISKHDCILVCNGEIYNYRELYRENKLENTTGSDCEIILDLYSKRGIDAVMKEIDGVFSFVLVDFTKNLAFVARDPFGVRPLFWTTLANGYLFGSELKSLLPVTLHDEAPVQQFRPGRIAIFKMEEREWFIHSLLKYKTYPKITDEIPIADISKRIVQQLYQAVEKRVLTTQRPIACLLSGGLDSSLITAMVQYCLKKHNIQEGHLQTFSIGLKGGEDLKYARMVAEYLGTQHHEIIIKEQDFIEAIPETICAIESYDTTTVRASVGNYLVSKYIRENTFNKVVFNGDGSDEICGGYLYFHYCFTRSAFDRECRRLLNNIHYFDVLRSDRSISSNGLEARTPFLDWKFVETYLSIPVKHRWLPGKPEKYLLRKAFEIEWPSVLPTKILWRTKEAFSDGVSSMKRSWADIIHNHTKKMLFNHRRFWGHLPPKTKEQFWYRMIWEGYFGQKHEDIIPYYWMPRFIHSNDASARALPNYSE